MLQILCRFYKDRSILWNLASKELRSRYLGTRLGLLWGLALPLFFIALIGFVFNEIFRIKTESPAFYILSGYFPWLFFANTVGGTMGVFESNQKLLTQYAFPKEYLVLARAAGEGVLLL